MRACAMRVSGIRLTFLDWDPWIRGGVNPGILRFSASTLEIFEKFSQTAPHWRFFFEFSKILVQGNKMVGEETRVIQLLVRRACEG